MERPGLWGLCRRETFRLILEPVEEDGGGIGFDEETDGGAESCILTIAIEVLPSRVLTDPPGATRSCSGHSVSLASTRDENPRHLQTPSPLHDVLGEA